MRARGDRTLIDLRAAPLDFAVRELIESAMTMARAALEALRNSLKDIEEAETMYRRYDAGGSTCRCKPATAGRRAIT